MRILLVHNFYGSASPSGENQVFETEKVLLLSNGHEVAEFTRHSDEIRSAGILGVLKGAIATPHNPFMVQVLQKKIEFLKPDVVHVHNTFPLISPAIFRGIGSRAARVLTLHNYRLFCPAAIPMRDGTVCTDCLDTCSVWPAIQHGCYRNSRLATLPLAANVALHRALGTWRQEVDAFIALTDFQRTIMVAAGLPAERVHVKPNYFPGNPSVIPWAERGEYAVFVGRLSAEKGVRTLVNAWLAWGADAPELRIVGDGPLRVELERAATASNIRFLGHLTNDECIHQISNARLLLLPSEWFETFGLAIIEAYAFGTPAAVSNLGPLPSIVNSGVNGVVFEPANPKSLLATVRQAWQSPGMLEQLGKGARESFERLYTGDTNYARLVKIYEAAILRSAELRKVKMS
jgi:glycosyltransferase involved in cell wall biosynthesis